MANIDEKMPPARLYNPIDQSQTKRIRSTVLKLIERVPRAGRFFVKKLRKKLYGLWIFDCGSRPYFKNHKSRI